MPLRYLENTEGPRVGVPVVEGQFQTRNPETYIQARSSCATLASALDCSGPQFSYVEHGGVGRGAGPGGGRLQEWALHTPAVGVGVETGTAVWRVTCTQVCMFHWHQLFTSRNLP